MHRWVASLDTGDRNAGTTRYSSTKKLFFEYMEIYNGWLGSAKRRMEVDLWLGRTGALLSLASERKEEVWIPKSEGRFLMAGKDCFRRCGLSHYMNVEHGRNTRFFMIMTYREDTSL